MRNPSQSPPALTEQQRQRQRHRQRGGSSSWSSSTPTPCCSKVGIKRGPWTAEEDEVLASFVRREGEGRWRTLPKRAGLLRCGKSCRLRWMNYLRPSIKRGPITADEEDLILRLHRLLGNRWSLIAGRIPGRTDNEIKNYWNTHLSKKLIKQGIDPRTHKRFTSTSAEPPPQRGALPAPPPPTPPPPLPSPVPQDQPVGGEAFAEDFGYKAVGCIADDVFSDLLMDSFIGEDINFMQQQDHFIANNNQDGHRNVTVSVVDSQNKDAELKSMDQLVGGSSSIPGFALEGIWADAFHYFR